MPTVTPEALDRAVDIIRERVDQLGVGEPEIQRSGPTRSRSACPTSRTPSAPQQQVGTPAQLYFYDWEANVLGPDGKPTRRLRRRTGARRGQTRATAGPAALRRVKLAAEQSDRRSDKGGSRIGSAYYLFDDKHRYLVAGPERLRADLLLGDRQERAGRQRAASSVPQGYVVLQAAARDADNRAPNDDPAARFYVLRDHVALSGKDIRTRSRTSTRPGSGQPIVEFEFTGKGARRSTTSRARSRSAARAPAARRQPGTAFQHFAVALDGS